MVLVSLVAATSMLTGCVNLLVPSTQISGSVGGAPFTFKGPKDVEIGSLNATANKDGTISLSISNLTSKNNPAVIQTTADAQVGIINAAIQGAATLSGKAAASAAKP